MTKSYIWPFFNRIVHILLIISFSITFILSEQSKYLDYHVVFATIFSFLFILRIIWGIIGPKYSKFSDFVFNKSELYIYLKNPFRKTKDYIGHNPASSYVIIIIILFTFLSFLTGMLLYGIEKNHGIFAYLHTIYYKDMLLLESIHKISVYILLAFIFVHIFGVLIDRFIKKGDALNSMLSGYTNLSLKKHIVLNASQKIFMFLSFFILFLFCFYLFLSKENIILISKNEKQDYAKINEEFEAECGSCHITYAPYLLPKKSWQIMMADLENHFGDDASIDEETNYIILKFLEQNSAENSTNEAAFKMIYTLKDKNTITITKTPYWEEIHQNIKAETFLEENIKSKANCSACHKDIEYGLIENHLIKY